MKRREEEGEKQVEGKRIGEARGEDKEGRGWKMEKKEEEKRKEEREEKRGERNEEVKRERKRWRKKRRNIRPKTSGA